MNWPEKQMGRTKGFPSSGPAATGRNFDPKAGASAHERLHIGVDVAFGARLQRGDELGHRIARHLGELGALADRAADHQIQRFRLDIEEFLRGLHREELLKEFVTWEAGSSEEEGEEEDEHEPDQQPAAEAINTGWTTPEENK